MALKGSLESLARRPKDTEGPPAILCNASIVLFAVSVCSATLVLMSFLQLVFIRFLPLTAMGFIASWLMTLIASAKVPRAKRALRWQTPPAVAAIVFFACRFWL